MILGTYVHGSRSAKGSSFFQTSLNAPQAETPRTFGWPVMVLAAALFGVACSPAKLFAQQASLPDQQASQGYPYNGQDPGEEPQPQSYSQQPYSYSDSDDRAGGELSYAPQTQVLGAEQLEQLVAPIALYPDTLVAQVLAASTYPAQVADADRWLQYQGHASPDQIAAGADAQSWDPSVKALTAFPQVLAQLDRNQQWTTDLGNAYYNQPQDVLGAVQVLRQRAASAGNLQSTPQEQVSYDQGNIELYPSNPQVVYVPSYDPWSVYGRPVSPYPGFSLFGVLGSVLDSSPVTYGLGMVMSAFTNTTWGWLGWGLDWLTQSVLFNHENYCSRSNSVADWGLPYGGARAFRGGHGGLNNAGWNGSGWNGINRTPRGYGRTNGRYGTGSGQGYRQGVNTNRLPVREGVEAGRGFPGRQSFAQNRSYPTPGRGYTPTAPYNHVQLASGGYNRPFSGYGSGHPNTFNGIRPGSVYSNSGSGRSPANEYGGFRSPAEGNRTFNQGFRGSAPGFGGQRYSGDRYSGGHGGGYSGAHGNGFYGGHGTDRSFAGYGGGGYGGGRSATPNGGGGFHLFGHGSSHGSPGFSQHSHGGGHSFFGGHSGGHSSSHSSGHGGGGRSGSHHH